MFDPSIAHWFEQVGIAGLETALSPSTPQGLIPLPNALFIEQILKPHCFLSRIGPRVFLKEFQVVLLKKIV